MHFDPLIQWSIFLVCFGIFIYLASLAARTARVGRKKDRKGETEKQG
ncbi:hypothetical protein ACFLUT_02200 [Chloroflexota bacterium]